MRTLYSRPLPLLLPAPLAPPPLRLPLPALMDRRRTIEAANDPPACGADEPVSIGADDTGTEAGGADAGAAVLTGLATPCVGAKTAAAPVPTAAALAELELTADADGGGFCCTDVAAAAVATGAAVCCCGDPLDPLAAAVAVEGVDPPGDEAVDDAPVDDDDDCRVNSATMRDTTEGAPASLPLLGCCLPAALAVCLPEAAGEKAAGEAALAGAALLAATAAVVAAGAATRAAGGAAVVPPGVLASALAEGPTEALASRPVGLPAAGSAPARS